MDTNGKSPIPLIVGAGPTGMILSLWLLKLSIPHRIVDAAPRTGLTSRAIVVHARTLEYYRQLDLADALIAKGARIQQFVIHHNDKSRAEIPIGQCGQGLSKYPFVLSVPQDEHEALLEQKITERGGKVERNIKVSQVEELRDKSAVSVMLNVHGKEETFVASYVVGCDGAHSAVRHSLGIGMEGGTYDRSYYVADIHTTGLLPPHQVNLYLSPGDFMVAIPFPHQAGRARLIGRVPGGLEDANPESIKFEQIEPAITRISSSLEIDKVNWFSHYKAHHRMAARFQQHRVFICGDAAHIHSPIGGQGMNTGLGDATNLAWKIAAAHNGAPLALLDTYETERTPFARKLVSTTDYAFQHITGTGLIGYLLRNIIMPFVLPVLLLALNLGPFFYKTVSQIQIEYRDSPVSVQSGIAVDKSAVKAGDRLPWVENADGNGTDNHAWLGSTAWQIHVYGKAPDWTQDRTKDKKLAIHVFPWSEVIYKTGIRQDVIYLVRPDGHIGLILNAADQTQNEAKFVTYLQKWIADTVVG